jgi:hypothetical protein
MVPALCCVPSAHNAIHGTLAVLRKLRDEETSACCFCRGLFFSQFRSGLVTDGDPRNHTDKVQTLSLVRDVSCDFLDRLSQPTQVIGKIKRGYADEWPSA